jgi:hypothetical protein
MATYGWQLLLDFIEWQSEQDARRASARELSESRRRSARMPSEGDLGGLGDIEALRRLLDSPPAKKAKRKASAYSKKYGRNFKKCMNKHKKKNGQWKKGGYKRCVREAHRMSRK